MAAEEDILLREVDDELQQDKTIQFFKDNGPWLLGAAGLAVAAVAGLQVYRGAEDRAAARNAEIYSTAVSESESAETVTADSLITAASETSGGYAGLARLRAAAILAQDSKNDEAVEALVTVISDGSLPTRLRDHARLRAATLLVDNDAAKSLEFAQAVTTESMKPLADELSAVSLMTLERYDEAYRLFEELSSPEMELTAPEVASRASLLAPVADAGRRGIALEVQQTEAEAFIESFSEQLMQGAPFSEAEGAENAEADIPETGDNR